MSVSKETNTYRQQLRVCIMETALKKFTQYGIRAVKMDDIASELSISKRTLYEIFKDKEEVLYESINIYNKRRWQYMAEYVSHGKHNVIDIIMEFYRMKINEVRSVNPVFYTDIVKYPTLVQLIKDNKERARVEYLTFMQRGVREGFLRPDVNYEMIPHMMDAMGLYIVNSKLLDNYTFEELFSNYFLVSLRGLCTEAGLKVIEETVI